MIVTMIATDRPSVNGHEAIEDMIERLDRDVKQASLVLTPTEMRYLVDAYYAIQKIRIQLSNAAGAALRGEEGEPVGFPGWMSRQMRLLETRLRSVMQAWADARVPGRWLLAQKGIGPVLAAGFLAHVDPERCRTAGQLWRFAGLDPTLKWLGTEGATRLVGRVVGGDLDGADDWDGVDPYALSAEEVAVLDAELGQPDGRSLTREQVVLVSRLSGRKIGNLIRVAKGDDGRITRASMLKALAKRPYNARLKVLGWKLGDSFVKLHNHDDCFYGQVYAQRKLQEVERNAAGLFCDQAEATLASKRISDPETRACYEAGRLPAGRIDLRARRYAVKLLLAHLQEVMYFDHFGEMPPKPYVIAHLDHTHWIGVPHGDVVPGLREAEWAAGAVPPEE